MVMQFSITLYSENQADLQMTVRVQNPHVLLRFLTPVSLFEIVKSPALLVSSK